MVRLFGYVLVWSICLAGCDKQAKEPDYIPHVKPPECTSASEDAAVKGKFEPILAAIRNQKTRGDGCATLDELIKRRGEEGVFRRFKDPKGCEWRESDRHPAAATEALIRRNEDELSQLCEWRRKDAERRGQQILMELSPEDRATVERAYNGM